MSDDLGTASLSTEVDLSGLEKGLGEAEGMTKGRLASLADGVKGALVAGMAGAGLAGAAALASSIGQAGDFEAAVNNLASVAGDSLAQAGFAFEDVSNKALQLGQSTAFSASQSIAAMTELVKGGVPVADVMGDATEATLNLAAAGQLELATAAEIVAKQLGVWGDQGVTATQVTDLLAQAANASTVGVEELAAGLANAQGTAETAGVEYQDLVQSMALLAPNFASAETAGTSLNNFLLRIQPSTADAKTAMQELGLYTEETGSVFYDAQGQFVGMEQAAELLQTATAGLSEAEKTRYLQTIFGNDAMGAAVALAGAGAEGFTAMGEAMIAAGTAADVAAVQNQGWNFAVDSLLGSLETFQIVVGSLLLPILTALVNEALIPAVGVLTTMAQALSGNAEAFNQLPGPIQAAVTLIQQVIGWFQQGSAATGEWASAFTAAQGLVGEAMAAIMGIVQPILATLSAFWAQHGAEIVAFAQQAWSQIGAIVAGVLAILQATVIPILTTIGGFIAAHSADIQALLGAAWANIQTVISGALAIIQGIINTVLAALRGDWAGAWAEIQGVVQTAISTVQEVISTTLGAVQTIWANNQDAILAKAREVWGDLTGAVEGGLQAALDAVEGLGGRFREAGVALIANLWDGVKARIDRLIADAKKALEGLSDMLPGSEPKDPTSPLRGLGRRGEAFVDNFAGPLLAGLEGLSLRPALAGLAGDLDAALGGELAGASAQADVNIRMAPGGESWLRNLVTVEAAQLLRERGRSAQSRKELG